MAKPRVLWDAKGKTREEWLQVRAHGPDGSLDFTLGGSDIPIIFGLSPWTTMTELWHIKKGNITPKKPDNEDQLEMGHLMEPIIGHFYSRMTGNEEIEDTLMYQHATRDYAIADLDGRFRHSTGRRGILEKKWITYRKSMDWNDGMVPPMYEMQGRWYLGVDDSDDLDFAAMWGNNPASDLATPSIVRDESSERMIFDRADAFIQSLRAGIPPKMDDYKNPKLALQSLARIYGRSRSGLSTVEFSTKYEKHIRMIQEMQARNAELKAEMKKNEEVIDAHSVPVAEAMKNHEVGELVTSKAKYIVMFPTRTTRRPDSKMLKVKHPAVFEEVLKVSESRSLKVQKEAV